MFNGIFGGGGGMFIVPSLYKQMDDEKQTHATTVSIILPICIISIISYSFFKKIEYASTLYYVTGGVFGGVLGSFLLKKCSNKFLRITFALFMIYSGVRMLISG